MLSLYTLFLSFVISLNVSHNTKVAHINLHTELPMAITIKILSISGTPLSYAAVINLPLMNIYPSLLFYLSCS